MGNQRTQRQAMTHHSSMCTSLTIRSPLLTQVIWGRLQGSSYQKYPVLAIQSLSPTAQPGDPTWEASSKCTSARVQDLGIGSLQFVFKPLLKRPLASSVFDQTCFFSLRQPASIANHLASKFRLVAHPWLEVVGIACKLFPPAEAPHSDLTPSWGCFGSSAWPQS